MICRLVGAGLGYRHVTLETANGPCTSIYSSSSGIEPEIVAAADELAVLEEVTVRVATRAHLIEKRDFEGVLSSSCPADTSRSPSAFRRLCWVAKVLRRLLKPVEASPQRTQYLDVTFQKYGSHVHQLQPS